VRTRGEAIATAARALALTRRPVGLLMWRGAHAWVMSGFDATANPATNERFTVSSIRVVDPWYPRPSSIWGIGQRPDTVIWVSKLATDATVRRLRSLCREGRPVRARPAGRRRRRRRPRPPSAHSTSALGARSAIRCRSEASTSRS
jgi:hypothetical protein